MEIRGKYRNPVYPFYFADPFVWKHEGEYYAVGTGPVGEKEVVGETDFTSYQMGTMHLAFPLLRSPDLVHWRFHGGAVKVEPEFQGGTFWAPEVAYNGEKFYIYYSVAKKGLEHQLRVASSAEPTGPFIDEGAVLPETDKCPFAIDAHPFQDVDGQWYLFYARDFLDYGQGVRAGTALVVDRLVHMTRAAGERRTVLRAKCDWQRFQENRRMYDAIYDWHTLEGPFVRWRDGKYYCFYSGGCYQGEGYGVDYGVADSVMGPYSDAGNEAGPRVLKTVPGRVIGPGHHSIVEGPDGKSDWLVYHAWDVNMRARRMCIDPLVWEADGPRCLGPS
jgi:GH43 family beta-xylosidase